MKPIAGGGSLLVLLFGTLLAVTLALPPTKPPCCPRHEVFTECGSACPATCDSILERNANRVCPDVCVRGCVCRDGFVRNRDGKCISPDQCGRVVVGSSEEQLAIRCRGKNEVFSECGSACPETCETIAERDSRPRVCTDNCVIGCTCREGYVRNQDGECVLPEECPKVEDSEESEETKCDCNEEFLTCGPSCPDTCDTYLGMDPPGPCDKRCRAGCFCKPGLVRNQEGKCVLTSECPLPVCPPNEAFTTCGTACPETCDTVREPNITRVCTFNCVIGCACLEGYVRNHDGRCVLPSECPEPEEECGPNEAFNECGTACPDTCDNLGDPTPRPCTKNCVPGCFCTEGFVRNDDGRCVLPSECPNSGESSEEISGESEQTECGPNEVFKGCGTACPKTCENLNQAIKCIALCVPGCFCQDGLVRNSEGQCVRPDQCPVSDEATDVKLTERKLLKIRLPITECGPNEAFEECGTACPDTCDNFGKPRPCTKNCVAGCFCQEGFVRNSDGQCVPVDQCPAPKCGLNEEFNGCGSACPETCESINAEPVACILVCVKGCFCKKGFVRNQSGQCVLASECPKPTGSTPTVPTTTPACAQNEIFSQCGTICPTTCDTVLGLTDNRFCPEICKIGCICQDGFVRNQNGQCVLPTECPGVASTPVPVDPGCGLNEEFSQCGSACPDTCDTISSSALVLPRVCPAVCRIGCVCRNGYVRNSDGKCVPPSQCARPKCGPREVYRECGSACPKTCRNVLNPNLEIACLDMCVAGCFCEDGLVRHHFSGACVSPKQCRRRPVEILTVASGEV